MARLATHERNTFYLKALENHRHLLKGAVDAMAKGDLIQALTIATSIRTLIHETGSSKLLLKHLRPSYLSIPIHSAKEPVDHPAPPGVQKMVVLKIEASLMISEGQFSLRPTMDVTECEEQTIALPRND